ncbi:hypothetical protein KCP74_11540 [Salmonella enterica subsp. enterica]|nr:hypothetical protein KCP74_11540 [Salmonella enterica subsp. enterica]
MRVISGQFVSQTLKKASGSARSFRARWKPVKTSLRAGTGRQIPAD